METPTLHTINDKSVLFVMAAPMEYGDALKARITPLICGVGPVEATMAVTRALQILSMKGTLPDLVVSLGSAGSPSLDQGEVYQVESVSYRDMDASPLGFTKGVTPFVDHPIDIPLFCPLKDVPKARLSTGANVVSGAAYQSINADMVDMETFAIKRVTDAYNTSLMGLRGISDGKDELSKYEDWTAYLADIDIKLAATVNMLNDAI